MLKMLLVLNIYAQYILEIFLNFYNICPLCKTLKFKSYKMVLDLLNIKRL